MPCTDERTLVAYTVVVSSSKTAVGAVVVVVAAAVVVDGDDNVDDIDVVDDVVQTLYSVGSGIEGHQIQAHP